MKQLIAIVLISLLFFSCKQKPTYDGVEVLVQQYLDEELISSDTLVIEENEIRFDPTRFDEGVYFILSVDTIAPQSLAEGFPFYIDELNSGTIKIARNDVVLGGNAGNEAYQSLRSKLKKLDADDIYGQLTAWDEFFAGYLAHPLGEEVFLNDFDPYNSFVAAPDQVERFLGYADESFLSRPEIIELTMWMQSLNKGALFR